MKLLNLFFKKQTNRNVNFIHKRYPLISPEELNLVKVFKMYDRWIYKDDNYYYVMTRKKSSRGRTLARNSDGSVRKYKSIDDVVKWMNNNQK